MTLPESILAKLASIDVDRACAIVKVTEATANDDKWREPVQVVEIAPGTGIIIVGPCPSLRKIEWLRLVEVAPMRFLLAIPSGTSIDSLEIAFIDLLEDKNVSDSSEREVLSKLRDLIRRIRLEDAVSKAEMLFIDTRRTRHNINDH